MVDSLTVIVANIQTHTNTYHLSPFVPKVIFVAMKCHSITKRKLTECLMGTSSSWTWLNEVKKLKCRFKINKNQRNPFDLKIYSIPVNYNIINSVIRFCLRENWKLKMDRWCFHLPSECNINLWNNLHLISEVREKRQTRKKNVCCFASECHSFSNNNKQIH